MHKFSIFCSISIIIIVELSLIPDFYIPYAKLSNSTHQLEENTTNLNGQICYAKSLDYMKWLNKIIIFIINMIFYIVHADLYLHIESNNEKVKKETFLNDFINISSIYVFYRILFSNSIL